MSSPAPAQSFRFFKSPDLTYGVWDTTRFETTDTSWVDLPGAAVDLRLGEHDASRGAVFVATFSAEALCSDTDGDGQGLLLATVFFGDAQSSPASDNHRYATARGNPEWSSRTFIRTMRFDPDSATRDVTARVRLRCAGAAGGVQNWFLRIDRFNL